MAKLIFTSPPPRTLSIVLAVCFCTIGFSGCRNYRQPCAPQPYTPYNNLPYGYGPPGFNGPPGINGAPGFNGNPGFNGAPGFNGPPGINGSQARISPPATYSLNIPGANNNPNGLRVGQLPNGLINTQQSAPTPVNRPANYNQQQGWRRSDGNDLNTSSTDQADVDNRFARATSANSVLESSARFNTPNPPSNGSGSRTASAGNAVGSGVSFTQSTDYQTTSTDERLDSTRLAVTDATNVRATAPFAQNQSGGGQYLQPYYQRQPNQPRYASLPPTTYYQGAFVRPNYGPLPPTQTFQGRFDQRFATPAVQQQQQVLAQSTTRYDPYQSGASTASPDWRDRGRESRSF